MGEVDPNDKSIRRYSVRHHKFDPETNHFRWFTLHTYNRQRQMNRELRKLWKELEERRKLGGTHPKEQIAGQISEPQSQEIASRRQFSRRFRKKNFRNRIIQREM